MALRPSTADDLDALYVIWAEAVRTTHDFLSPEDSKAIAQLVKNDYLPNAEFVVAVDAKDRPIAFMGMTGGAIDSLFVHPSSHGRGVGRTLIDHARARHQRLAVDVNEQNEGACRFYQRMGFIQTGRSALDDQGRPYPLLHMALKVDRA